MEESRRTIHDVIWALVFLTLCFAVVFYSMLPSTTDLVIQVLCVVVAVAGIAVIVMRELTARGQAMVGILVLLTVWLLKAAEAHFIAVFLAATR